MHLDVARREGRRSDDRDPSGDLGGGVNAVLEFRPHVGHLFYLLSYSSRAAYGATAAPNP